MQTFFKKNAQKSTEDAEKCTTGSAQLMLSVTHTNSLSLRHCLPLFPFFSHSASILRIYFLIEFTTEIVLGQRASAAPDSIKCPIQFYNIVFIWH